MKLPVEKTNKKHTTEVLWQTTQPSGLKQHKIVVRKQPGNRDKKYCIKWKVPEREGRFMIFSPNFQGRVSITFCSDVCRDKGPSYDHFAVVITKLDVSCCMRLGYSRACVFGCIYMCTLWLVCVNTAPFKKQNAPHFHSFYLRNELKTMLKTEFREYETVNFLF